LLLYFVRKKGTMMHNVHNILENQDKDKSDLKVLNILQCQKCEGNQEVGNILHFVCGNMHYATLP
jgi:hypothetical protein